MKQPRYERGQQLGVVFDITPDEVPADKYTDALNISFRDLSTARIEGYSKYSEGTTAITVSPIWAMSVRNQGVNWWLYFSTDQVWATDGTAHYNLTPTGGLIACLPGEWTGTVLNGIPVFNNPANPPMYWDLVPTNEAQVLPGWPANTFCGSMRSTKYHLIAMAINENGTLYPTQLWWSSGAQAGSIPQEWTPTAENDAGDVVLASTPGRIIDAYQLRDVLMIYKEDSTYQLTYVAGQYVYAQRQVFATIGTPARNCVAEINGEHWIFTGQDIVRHDGQVYRSVADNVCKRAIVDTIDPNKIQICNVVPRIVDQQVWVCFAETGNDWLSKAYVIDAIDDNVGVRTLPQVASVNRGIVNPDSTLGTWDDATNAWDDSFGQWSQTLFSPNSDSLLMTDPNGQNLFAVGVGDTADGQPIRAYVEKVSAEVGDPYSRKMITRFVPRIEGSPGDVLKVRLGSQAFFGQSVTWNAEKDFVIGTDVAVSDIVEGRLMAFRIEGNTNKPWQFHSYTIHITEQGVF